MPRNDSDSIPNAVEIGADAKPVRVGPKGGRIGRPPGSLNKKTLEKQAVSVVQPAQESVSESATDAPEPVTSGAVVVVPPVTPPPVPVPAPAPVRASPRPRPVTRPPVATSVTPEPLPAPPMPDRPADAPKSVHQRRRG